MSHFNTTQAAYIDQDNRNMAASRISLKIARQGKCDRNRQFFPIRVDGVDPAAPFVLDSPVSKPEFAKA